MTWAALICTTAIAAAAPAPQTRAPSAAELASFDSYYQQRYPGNPVAKPVFSITRARPNGPWSIVATVDSVAQASSGRLCRMTRNVARYSGKWTADAARAYAWMERPACVNPARAVEMLHPMPDVDVSALLANSQALLRNARILLAGNTGCASGRSFNFALAKIDVGTAGAGTDMLAGLVFNSDHDTEATVWVRRSGLEYRAWNVSCKKREPNGSL